MKALGTQHLVEFIDCQSLYLNNAKRLERIILESLEYAGLNYIKMVSHQFDPVGVTVVAIISESHIGVHTYPEAKHISLDLYTCTNTEKHIRFIKYFEELIKPSSIRIAQLLRGNPIEIKDTNWITNYTEHGFDIRYYVENLIYEHKTSHQLIEIIENQNFGRMLFIDRMLQTSENDAQLYNKNLLQPIINMQLFPENILVIGGADGGILTELLKFSVDKITLLEPDNEIIEAAKKFLPKICLNSFNDSRIQLHYEDSLTFLNDSNNFDAIIYNQSLHTEAFTNIDRQEYLNELFIKLHQKLKVGGILCTQVGSQFDKKAATMIGEILDKLFVTTSFSNTYIPSFCDIRSFASAIKIV